MFSNYGILESVDKLSTDRTLTSVLLLHARECVAMREECEDNTVLEIPRTSICRGIEVCYLLARKYSNKLVLTQEQPKSCLLAQDSGLHETTEYGISGDIISSDNQFPRRC